MQMCMIFMHVVRACVCTAHVWRPEEKNLGSLFSHFFWGSQDWIHIVRIVREVPLTSWDILLAGLLWFLVDCVGVFTKVNYKTF